MISDKQKALILKVKSQIGVHEVGGNNSGAVVEMYQRVIGKAEKEPWCCSFIQWCVREVDKAMSSHTLLYATESTQMLWTKTPQVARLPKPEPGCVVVWTKFKGDLPLSIGHCGIVVEVLDDDWILTVEGNTSDSTGISREGDGVYMKRRSSRILTGYMRTAGYLLPWA